MNLPDRGIYLCGVLLTLSTLCPLQVVTNCKNTVQAFKRFHGRAFTDPYIQAAKPGLAYELAQMPHGTTGVKVITTKLW